MKVSSQNDLGFTLDRGGEELGLAGISKGNCRMFLANRELTNARTAPTARIALVGQHKAVRNANSMVNSLSQIDALSLREQALSLTEREQHGVWPTRSR